ncbi:MAG: hypothetical protein IKB82_04055 [Clostridia bacterium]|nr:hypothetical protein [Clostridia bacterium]
MHVKIVPLILLACALVLALMSAGMFGYGKRFLKNAVSTQATVVSFSTVNNHGQRAPVVEFTAKEDGKLVRKPAQPAAARHVQRGDTVDILYQRKKVFGLDSWNIFIIRDALSKPFGIYAVFGWILLVLALILGAAAIAVFML